VLTYVLQSATIPHFMSNKDVAVEAVRIQAMCYKYLYNLLLTCTGHRLRQDTSLCYTNSGNPIEKVRVEIEAVVLI